MDANGCTGDTTLDIIEPMPFTAVVDSASQVRCYAGNDGAIYVTLAGGTQPYDVIWSGPSGWSATTPDITGLAEGTYTLSVNDLNGCALYNFIEDITQPEEIVITSALLSDYGGFGVTCPESADGSVTVTVTGGTAPLALLWNGPAGFVSTQASISLLSAGTYSLTITDSNGCVITNDYDLTAPDTMVPVANTVSASCPDTPDGSIDLAVTGGSGTLTYLWDDGVTTQDRTNILPGDYNVTVTDGNGCIQTLAVTVDVIGYNCLRIYEIITPNGDGRNDTWQLRNAEIYPDAEVFVYSRWGKLVYHSRNATDEWDGTYNGKVLPNDSYHYVIHPGDGSEPRTGVITIISK